VATRDRPFERHRAARATRHIFKARPTSAERFAQFGESAAGGRSFRGLLRFAGHRFAPVEQ